MASIVNSFAISGVEAYLVDVEVKTITGQPLIAIGILIETGQLVRVKKESFGIIGELSLNSRLRACSGILPMVIAARNAGVKNVIVPLNNLQEASLVTGVKVYGFEALKDVVDFLEGKKPCQNNEKIALSKDREIISGVDFVMFRGRMA